MLRRGGAPAVRPRVANQRTVGRRTPGAYTNTLPLPEELRKNALASGDWQAKACPTVADKEFALVGQALACHALISSQLLMEWGWRTFLLRPHMPMRHIKSLS